MDKMQHPELNNVTWVNQDKSCQKHNILAVFQEEQGQLKKEWDF